MFTAQEWQRIKSGYRGPEDFYPFRHASSKDWGRGFAVPDSAVLSTDIGVPQPGMRTEFPITNLIHVTDFNGAQGILNDQCLKKANIKQIGEQLKVRFSWWSVQVSPEEMEREREFRRSIVEEQIRQTIQDPLTKGVRILREALLEQYVSSPAFLEQSNYGNFKITYNINDLIGEYKKSVCQGKDPEFRVLGTFRYNIEIMHTVVVHPPGVGIFEHCPPLPSDVISREGTKWMWKPQSTGAEVRVLRQNDGGSWWVDECYPDCRRWEFVSFAFYLPDEKPEFPVPLECKHLTVCEMEKSQRFRKVYLPRDKAEEICRSLCPLNYGTVEM